MSLLELEHAATAPSRFIRLMRKYDLVADTTDERLSPMAKQLLHLRLPGKPGAVPAHSDSFQDIHLVPGGRFLFTLSQDYFHIWDLGRNAYSGLKPLPLYVKAIEDILDIQSDRVRLPATLLLYHAEAADRILFSIYCRHAFGTDVRSVVRVFDAELPVATSAKAVVHRVAQLEYNISVRPTAINEVHVILAGSDTDTEFQHDRMIVWDYRTDALASLKAEKHDQALMFGESIAVPHSLDLSVYRMPALVHSLHTGPAPIRAANVHHAPDQFAVNVTAAADSRVLAWSIPKPWFCDPVTPPTLDLFTTTTIHRFSMAKIAVPPAAAQALPDHVPYVSAQISVDLLGQDLTDTHLRSAPCEDHTSFLFTLSHPMDFLLPPILD
ncbi:hypothetical protein K525DRAFT_263758 [Schizophyllum commune Loenen D]|nr:hypothetical protein K525DRAFT_263758 [Schizophyllum commune Loenen D]